MPRPSSLTSFLAGGRSPGEHISETKCRLCLLSVVDAPRQALDQRICRTALAKAIGADGLIEHDRVVAVIGGHQNTRHRNLPHKDCR
jgi:hypothetical protein